MKSVRQDTEAIQHGQLHMNKIDEGMIGLAFEGNMPVLLPAGTYASTSSQFVFKKASIRNIQVRGFVHVQIALTNTFAFIRAVIFLSLLTYFG